MKEQEGYHPENISEPSKQWYKVEGKFGHLGAGKSEGHTHFVYAQDPIDALDKAKNMSGWHKQDDIPTISPLAEDAVGELEALIGELGLSMDLIQEKGLNGRLGKGKKSIFIDELLRERVLKAQHKK